MGSLCMAILPWVMRDTSSKSSTSRDRLANLSLDDVLLARLLAAQTQQLKRGQNRRERISQLVSEHGQELVFGRIGVFGLLGEPLQLAAREDLLGDVDTDGDDAIVLRALPVDRSVDEGPVGIREVTVATEFDQLFAADIGHARSHRFTQDLVEPLTLELW